MDEEYLSKLSLNTPYSGNSLTYIDFLFKTLVDNFNNQNYHFASFALHQLYMTTTYISCYQIARIFPDRYKDALLMMSRHGEKRKKLLELEGPFSFAELNEADCFHLFEIIGLDESYQGKCKSLVRERNNTAHANGNIRFMDGEELFLEEADKYIHVIEELREKLHPYLLAFVGLNLSDIIDEEMNEDSLAEYLETTTMQELFLSQADIKKASKFRYDNPMINNAFKRLVASEA